MLHSGFVFIPIIIIKIGYLINYRSIDFEGNYQMASYDFNLAVIEYLNYYFSSFDIDHIFLIDQISIYRCYFSMFTTRNR